METRLKMHTYREGGSMICDEKVVSFETIPTEEQIKKELEKYRKEYNYKERVYFNLSGSGIRD